MKLKDYITEYVSSGRGYKRYKLPNDIDSLIDWLKTLGVEHFENWNGSIIYPHENGIYATIGPCRNGRPGTFWVSLQNNPSSHHYGQRIVARIYTTSEVEFNTCNIKIITFDEAIRLMEKMVLDPTKLIDDR